MTLDDMGEGLHVGSDRMIASLHKIMYVQYLSNLSAVSAKLLNNQASFEADIKLFSDNAFSSSRFTRDLLRLEP